MSCVGCPPGCFLKFSREQRRDDESIRYCKKKECQLLLAEAGRRQSQVAGGERKMKDERKVQVSHRSTRARGGTVD